MDLRLTFDPANSAYRLPPLPYLTEVLTQLPTAKTAAALDVLLPHRWSAAATPIASTPSAEQVVTH
jgi:hypothetical protein